MVIYDTIKAFKEKGVYQIALKSGMINTTFVLKAQIYEYYMNCDEPLNKKRIEATCVFFDVDRRYVYEAIRFIKNN